MNLSSSSMELNGTLKEMRQHWEETKEVWRDPVCTYFEERYWLPLQAHVLSTLRAIERLSPILERLHHDCG
jgi:hypothetical protein